MYFSVGSLIIGVPFSIVTDLILSKKKKSINYLLMGLILHLVFAGIIVFLFTFTESDDILIFSNVLINSVFGAAAGLWLVDSFLKKIQLLR
jgi:lipopolysaccharide export LptBFGC system permease protein LptF